jgi:glutathione peroxidase-family protein
MDERYESWEDIKAFYELLDKMSGLDSEGEVVTKAQVTGKIHVTDIPYAAYMELSVKYPEVTIDTNTITCTVTFLNEYKQGEIRPYLQKFIPQGTTCELPSTPNKEMTESHYFNFEAWEAEDGEILTAETVILTDRTYISRYSDHIRSFTVTFNPSSDRITVNPTSRVAEYGTAISAPELHNIPELVTHTGWYRENTDQLWNFATDLVYKDEVLVAHWVDESKPSITSISRISYNTFTVVAQDNLGISSYALTYNSVEAPDTWIELSEAQTVWQNTFTIDKAGTWRIWISDKSGQTASGTIQAYSINSELSDGITSITALEDTTQLSDFALYGTPITYFATIDHHFENLHLYANTTEITLGNTYEITSDIQLTAKCSPKSFTIRFVTGVETEASEPISEPSQTKIYRELIDEPPARYRKGKIIEGWYLDLSDDSTRWDFTTGIVDTDKILYAKWVALNMPTKFTVHIDTANTIISLNLRAKSTSSVISIDWGDDSTLTEISNQSANVSIQNLKHTFTIPGDYIIQVACNEFGYELGGNKQAVLTPIKTLTNIEFSWDLDKVNSHAFQYAPITSLIITDYMTEIGDYAFTNCTALVDLTLGRQLLKIGTNAFERCTAISSLKLPASLTEIKNYAFNSCSSVSSVEMDHQQSNLKVIGSYAFQNCANLSSFTIPHLVETVGSQALAFCTELASVKILSKSVLMGQGIFDADPGLLTAGPLGGTDAAGLPYNIQFIWGTTSDSTSIPNLAFAYGLPQSASAGLRSYLQVVEVPYGITRIGTSAFKNTASLKNISLPESLEEIAQQAFSNTNLSTLVIPASVTRMEPQMCMGAKLTQVYIKTAHVNEAGNTINLPEDALFYNCNYGLTIYVPMDPALTYDIYGKYWDVRLYVSDPAVTHTVIPFNLEDLDT